MKKLFEEIRELAYRYELFKKYNNSGEEYPTWNKDYYAEYVAPCKIHFTLESHDTDLSDTQKEILKALKSGERFDDWKVESVKINVDDMFPNDLYIDFEIVITNL